MLIALDAMGGDYAPEEPCRGAMMACLEKPRLEVALLGDSTKINPIIEKAERTLRPRLHVIHTSEVINSGDSPSLSIKRKKDSSLSRAFEMVRAKEAKGVVSAGNTGAMVAAGVLILGRIPGIDRPGMGVVLPVLNRPTLLMDVGATVRCKPINLHQFALMGTLFMKTFRNVENPSIKLLSNGEELIKGDEVIMKARALIESSRLNFDGYAEGKDIVNGVADVIICDGFTGNVVIKFGEGLGELLNNQIKEEYDKHLLTKIGLFFMWPSLKRIVGRFDWERHGGSVLLGVNGTVVKVHGRSKRKPIANALISAANFAEANGVERIAEEISKGVIENGID